MDLSFEVKRTKPDIIVYIPRSEDGSTHDTGNEHFLVFEMPDGNLGAIWTQSSYEGAPDQRIVFSSSKDIFNWEKPKVIAGSGKNMASWGFPLVSSKGRIYVIYSQHTGKFDTFFHTTGLMAGIYSDDCGKTWSEPEVIDMPRSIYDNPDKTFPSNWIVFQKPERISKGKYFTGFTRWISKERWSKKQKTSIRGWYHYPSVVEFMRFENIDENPDVKDIEISYFSSNEKAIKVPLPENPEISVCQEPSIVKLPDNRLFCIMRTFTGSPWYTISEDEGENWSEPEILRYRDDGEKILHPISPCPIYRIDKERYFFLFHNNDGNFEKWKPKDTEHNRRPLYISEGKYMKEAKQPVWFSEPEFLMDTDAIPLGPLKRVGLPMYGSFTIFKNKKILWYPDRKFFLLGKFIKM